MLFRKSSMSYINQYILIKATQDCKSGYLDRKGLMSTVNRHQIMKRIEKTNPEFIKTGRFYITEEPIEEENWSKMSETEKKKILRLYEKIKQSKDLDSVIRDLESYKTIYPNVPTIYNYLGIAYERANQLKKYYKTLIETKEKFPDYLFGKISLAEYYLSDKKFKKIPDLLENKFEITQHFPSGTDAFHISAVRGFYYVTGRYFTRVRKIGMAFKSYFLLSDLDIDHITTEILGQEIIGYELSDLKRKMRRK